MLNKTCPLCGGKLKNNYCESCGYDVPGDDDLSALYDMNPENDAFGEVVREITPEVQTEEIYPNRPAGFDTAYEQPKFKVRDNKGKTVHQNYQNQSPPPPPFAGQNVGNGGAYGTPPNTGAQNNGGNYVPPPSPFANQGGQTRQTQYADTGEFIKNNWWMLLISFLIPPAGFILFFTVGKNFELKYKRLLLIAAVLGFVLHV